MKQEKTPEELYQQFVLNGRDYRDLHSRYSLNDHGIWRVVGESTEHGSGPQIGIYEGTLEHVIRFAVIQPRFWSYGSGGYIEKVEIKQVDALTVKTQVELRDREQELKDELARVQDRLKEIS